MNQTYVGSPIGGFEAAVSGVQRDVISADQVVVGTEATEAPSAAAAPHQLEREDQSQSEYLKHWWCKEDAY